MDENYCETESEVSSVHEFVLSKRCYREWVPKPKPQREIYRMAQNDMTSPKVGVKHWGVFDFDNPPNLNRDTYTDDIREQIGITQDDILILQPTRIVPRKGIEHAIKLVGMLNDSRFKLVISHDAGDEGLDYKNQLVAMAEQEGVDLRFFAARIGEVRQVDHDGNKIYTLWDIYKHADLMTYPSTYEGFGNALLEAIYFKVPVLINRYSIYVQDIEPKGFRLVEMDGFITPKMLKEVRRVVEDKEYRDAMVEHNYKVATRYYSYTVLRRVLRHHIAMLTGEAHSIPRKKKKTT